MVGAPEERVVFDISSDEEVEGEGEGEDGGGGDSTWIADLLEVGDGGTSENSDDVIVVKEVILKTPKRKFNYDDDDDDDCVVLEEDPDKPVQVHSNGNGGAADDDDDSDDLLVVSEKGQRLVLVIRLVKRASFSRVGLQRNWPNTLNLINALLVIYVCPVDLSTLIGSWIKVF